MARKRIFSTSRFDGGMTHDIRDLSDLSRCAFSSHFDVYGNPHEMSVMPGYVSDESYNGVADGIKQFGLRAFWYGNDDQITAVGTKADGTGSRMFHKTDPTTGDWIDGRYSYSGVQEGTYNLFSAPYARLAAADSQEMYVTTKNGSNMYWTSYSGSGVTDGAATIYAGSSTNQNPVQVIRGAEGYSNQLWYNAPFGDLGALSPTPAPNSWDTGTYYINHLVESSRGLWTIGYTFHPYNTEVRLWDRNSALSDQVVQIPNARGGAIGIVGGTPVIAVDEFIDTLKGTSVTPEQVNGLPSFSIRAISGTATETLYRYTAPTTTGGRLLPVSNQFKDAFLFYGKFATDAGGTTFRQGIWAVGRSSGQRPIALSLLLDTTDLGQLDGYFGFANHHFFAHGGDGSVSRLGVHGTGTYDVTATYETLLLGSDTPYEKQLNGITVKTTELPAGASVTCYYRTDPDDAWTSMGSSTGGKEHTFTRTTAGMVGNFQEIQFKLEIVGKVKVTGLTTSLNELDSLPYNL